jgi:hypothetical protein
MTLRSFRHKKLRAGREEEVANDRRTVQSHSASPAGAVDKIIQYGPWRRLVLCFACHSEVNVGTANGSWADEQEEYRST